MKIKLLAEAEQDLRDGFQFYQSQQEGLGHYFLNALTADIDSLAFFAGVHERIAGFHRALSRRFPFAIYYTVDTDIVIVKAILDCRRKPAWVRLKLSE
ncbi:hypothetical protein [Desulfoplanes sp.]